MRTTWIQSLLLAGIVLAASACKDSTKSGAEGGESPTAPDSRVEVTLLPERQAEEGALFVKVSPGESGIDLVQSVNAEHPFNFLYVGGFMCGGVAVGDVDGDGKPDLFFAVNDGENRLYRQTGDWKFEDIAVAAGVGGGPDAWGAGAAMVDIEGDGDLDIYVCNYRRANQLFVNEGVDESGDVRFVERAEAFGLNQSDGCLMPYFCDYDGDGDLDVFIVCYRYYRPGGAPTDEAVYEIVNGKAVLKPAYEPYFRMMEHEKRKLLTLSKGRRDFLLRNDGGRFTDVTEKAGIFGTGFGLSAAWWDYNEDGRPDLYVANDFENADRLYQNNGNGTFTNVIQSAMPHTSWYSMGSAAGDLNNDGRGDLVVLDMAGTSHFKEKLNMGEMTFVQNVVSNLSEPRQMMRNTVFYNTGTGRMLEAGFLSGLAKTDWSWAPILHDFDNDGRLDLFVTNGMSRNFMDSDVRRGQGEPVGKTEWSLYANQAPNMEQNFAFRNRGGMVFEDVSNSWGLDHVGISMGAASGDLDGDGDADLIVANVGEPIGLYRNTSAEGHRLMVRLQGEGANSAGIGATVRVETENGNHVRTLQPHSGFLGSHLPELHFGLGSAERIERLTVDWPSGVREVYRDLPADHLVTITQSGGGKSVTPPRPEPRQFQGGLIAGIEPHVEKQFDDFALQPLLPNKLSRLGPGLAWGDINGDGAEEVFVGGAAGQPGRIYRRNKDLSFTAVPGVYEADAACEDMAALFFDADSDSDLDLYVVSGSYEYPSDHPAQADRLYLNDGTGRLEKAPAGVLPDVRDCGSVATACDFDRDGDLDLFVGSRVVPGKYPLSPTSRLLINESGRFLDRTAELAPGLRQTGLVTSAVWSDADGDGWGDLLVAHEWGPVKLFRNENGKLTDQTEAAGLSKLLGWWNSLAAGDFDGDGDMDYVAGNVGLNTKYSASAEKPVRLYYGDFEGKGVMHLVEAKYENGVLLPIRGKSCSTRAMPSLLKEKFGSFRQFAVAGLPEIYPEKCLEDAHQYSVTELQSGVLRNDGKGRFEFLPLPLIAQIAPCFGMAITEINGDGKPDLYAVQNLYAPQLETGRFDSGISQLLTGNGDGTFTPVEAAESGLIVVGDAKSLAVTDLDGDRRPDFVVGTNNGKVWAYAHAGPNRAPILQVRLRGGPGNPDGVGARVTLQSADGSCQTAEVSAGGGYLSQSSPALYFGLAKSARAASLTVRWPDGSETRHAATPAWKSEGVIVTK